MLSSLSHGYRILLITSAVTTILSIVFNYLMPQVIRFAIDTVLGDQPSSLPAALTAILIPDKQDVMRNLIACAIVINDLFPSYPDCLRIFAAIQWQKHQKA